MSAEPLRSVPAVLASYDSTFSEYLSAFNRGQYVLWLGSGISRDKVPNVSDLLVKLLETLRTMVDPQDEACVYRNALRAILGLAGFDREYVDKFDFSVKVTAWDGLSRTLNVLSEQYSKVLDVQLGAGHREDYLVWEGLDVPNTYGAPDLEPDVEHYCVAVLMLEGLVSSAVTANWDGLVEKALGLLVPSLEAVAQIVVAPEDFREEPRRTTLIKFHGCAVRARDNEAEYRDLLIARQSQISAWTSQHSLMRKQLGSRPTVASSTTGNRFQ